MELSSTVSGAKLACGCARSLLFEIVPGQPKSVGLPLLTLTAAVLAAVLPPAFRVSDRSDPVATLRSK